MSDVLVVGGGVIGLSVAFELARAGVGVRVVDQGAFGQEASWAGAGMLPPGNPAGATTPEARLRAESHVLWHDLSAELRELTGVDNGYVRCGGLELAAGRSPVEVAHEIAAWRREGVAVEPLAAAEIAEHEPHLIAPAGGYRLPQMGQVRNPRHLKALLAGCAARGVILQPGTPVTGWDRAPHGIRAVRTPTGPISAGSYVVCSGAWSGPLLAACGLALPVRPVRGQIVLLSALPRVLRHVVGIGPRYLVPRADGRILIGSTEEEAGFDKQNTAEGIAGLLHLALETVPALRAARFERAWAGLRPASRDGLPYLGRVPEYDNLCLAAGHFRSGLQMSPITGRLLAELLTGRPPRIPLEPYACQRHA